MFNARSRKIEEVTDMLELFSIGVVTLCIWYAVFVTTAGV